MRRSNPVPDASQHAIPSASRAQTSSRPSPSTSPKRIVP